MSIRRHGHRWQVRLRLGGGQRIERTLPRGATRDDARALEATLRREAIRAASGRAPAHTVDDAIDRWLDTGARELRSYQRDLRYRFDVLRQYTAGQPIEALADLAARITRDGLSSGLTPAAINRYLALLRRLGNLAERWGWTDQPLGRRVPMLPERSERHVYLTPADVRRLCRRTDPHTADLIRLAVVTGLRRGELLALRAEQVRDDMIILDAATKSGRPRAVPLPPEAQPIAARALPARWTADGLRDRWEAARERAGLPHVRWHDLRHTYASWLVQAGQPLAAVRDLLGHSSLAVTHRYAHLAPAHLVQAVAALPALGGDRVGTKRRPKTAKKTA